MMKFVYIGLFNIIQILRTIIYPLTWCFLPKFRIFAHLKQRKGLESSCNYIPLSGYKADFCFHFSSVGELEQCSPIIAFLTERGKKIELLYTSDSVSKTLNRRFGDLPEQVRIIPLPLLKYNLFKTYLDKIITANTITMVRYDFFPELILHARKKRSILLSATLINKKITILNKSWFKFIYSSFDKVFTSTEEDHESFSEILGIDSDFAELRIDQIRNRIDQSLHEFSDIPCFKDNAILFGSVWPSDIINLKSGISKFMDNGGQIFLAPHNLDSHSVNEISSLFIKETVSIIDSPSKLKEERLNQVNILVYKGKLLETYTRFKLVYVGGGFERSIHSVLEPYLGNCYVLCGPKVYRSTEFQVINEVDSNVIKSVDNSESFSSCLHQFIKMGQRELKSVKIFQNHLERVIGYYGE